MSKASIIKTFTVLFAMIFLFVQGASQAHATEHGDHHDHDGVPCDIVFVAVEHVISTPPAPIPSPMKVVTKSNWTITLTNGCPRVFDSRAPPPRGPPTE